MKACRRVEARYLENVLIGTRFGDVLERDANWHRRFNWVCNVHRDLVRHGGAGRALICEFVKANLQELRKGKK